MKKQIDTVQETYFQLDETICKLESMGTILTQLATNEGQEPELSSLADLGRVIQFLAMEALDLKTKIEVFGEVNNDHQTQEAPGQVQGEGGRRSHKKHSDGLGIGRGLQCAPHPNTPLEETGIGRPSRDLPDQ